MTVYSYAQLEGLWLQAAKGTRYATQTWAALMAAIAEAESGGNSDARNPSGATGLWQILGNPFPGNAYDPSTNAQMALSKLQSQGLGAWTTYTSGAYKPYLSSGTTPDTQVPGSPTSQAALTAAAGTAACLWSFGGIPGTSLWNDLFGSGGNIGSFCILSKSQGRAILGMSSIVAGGLLILAGLGFTGMFSRVPGTRAAQQIVLRIYPAAAPPPPRRGGRAGGGPPSTPAGEAGQPAQQVQVQQAAP